MIATKIDARGNIIAEMCAIPGAISLESQAERSKQEEWNKQDADKEMGFEKEVEFGK